MFFALPGRSPVLEVKTSLRIGRGRGNHLIIPRGNVSRRHCEIIQQSDGQVVVIDRGSSGGTYLTNGRRTIGDPHPLASGHGILIGDETLLYLESLSWALVDALGGVTPLLFDREICGVHFAVREGALFARDNVERGLADGDVISLGGHPVTAHRDVRETAVEPLIAKACALLAREEDPIAAVDLALSIFAPLPQGATLLKAFAPSVHDGSLVLRLPNVFRHVAARALTLALALLPTHDERAAEVHHVTLLPHPLELITLNDHASFRIGPRGKPDAYECPVSLRAEWLSAYPALKTLSLSASSSVKGELGPVTRLTRGSPT